MESATGTGSVAQRLGFGPLESRDDAFAWRCLGLVLLLYVVSFAFFYPNGSTNDDEALYQLQSKLVLEGSSTIRQIDPLSGEEVEFQPVIYVPGLATLMAPFVHLFGWRGAYVVPLAGLLLAVVFTGLLLRREGRSPVFALLVFGFAPTLVMSRVTMTDVPSAAVVALGLYCFFRGLDGSARWWLAAGFVAGASLTLRFSNPLLFAPLFAGTVIRREWRCWALVVGGVAGLALRVLVMTWYFGDPFFERAKYHLAIDTLLDRLPYYLVGLLVLLPGGLVLALAYRGRRRPEVIVSILLFVSFYLFQLHSTDTAGAPKRLVLVLRYMIPLVPLIALACGESAPRLWSRWIGRRAPERRDLLVRRTSGALLTAVVALAAGGALVHPAFHWWGGTQARIREAIRENVPLDAVLVTNYWATRKFAQEGERRFTLMRVSDEVWKDPTLLRRVAARYPETFVVMLDRSDSDFWRRDAAKNEALLEAFEQDGLSLEPRLDQQASANHRLRIWRVALADAPRPSDTSSLRP